MNRASSKCIHRRRKQRDKSGGEIKKKKMWRKEIILSAYFERSCYPWESCVFLLSELALTGYLIQAERMHLMTVTAEAFTAVFQHDEADIRYSSMRENSFLKWADHTSLCLVVEMRIPHCAASSLWGLCVESQAQHSPSPMTSSLTRRGSTAEADLSVIHKHLRHTHTHEHTEPNPLFLTWD